MALLSSTTGSLTGAMTGPILNWDPVPGLKYDKKRTDEGIKLNQFKTLTGQLLSTCTKKNGGGLLKDGTMKKKRMFVSYPRSGSTWMLVTIMNLFGIVSDRLDPKLKIPKDCGCTLTTRTHDFSVMRQTNYTKSEEVDEYDGNAILLIRNPFRAIMSRRALSQYLKNRPASLNETYIEDEGNQKGDFFTI